MENVGQMNLSKMPTVHLINPPARPEVDWETTLQMDEKRTLYSDISKYMRTFLFKKFCRLAIKTRQDCYEFVMLFEFRSLSVLRLLLAWHLSSGQLDPNNGDILQSQSAAGTTARSQRPFSI